MTKTELEYLQLLGDEPIHIEGIGLFRSPTIRDICAIGEDTYRKYLDTIYNLRNGDLVEALVFDEMTRQLVADVFDFFVRFDKIDDGCTGITGTVCDIILQMNYISQSKTVKAKPKNKRATEIMEKIENANLNLKNTDKSQRISIGELVSIVCGMKTAYNYNNVYDLTIYQLYDLFYGLLTAKNYDLNAMRYAAWGGDNFDFNGWMKRKQEDGALS